MRSIHAIWVAFAAGWKKAFTTAGRARRLEYWSFVLGNFIIRLGLSFVDVFLGTFDEQLGVGFLGFIYLLAAIPPGFTLTVRRLHDLNLSGWAILLLLIPLVNVVFWLYLAFADGTPGPNRFGPDPKGRRVSVGYGDLP